MVDAGGGCIGWGARDRDLMRGTVTQPFDYPNLPRHHRLSSPFSRS